MPLPLKIVIGLLLIFGLIVGGCEWKIASDLSDAEKLARKCGIALTYAEFRQHLPKPIEAENAALEIKKIALLRPGRTPAEGDAQNLLNKPNPTPAEWSKIEAIRPQLDKVSEIADSLGSKTAVDFNREWELGYEVLFPEYAQIKNTVKLIGLRARLLAYRGNRLGALKELKKAVILSELVDTEPTLIAMLVTVACETICFNLLNTFLSNGPLSSEEILIVRDMRRALGEPKPLSNFIHGEAAATYMSVIQGKPFPLLQLDDGNAAENGFISFMLKTSFRKVILTEYLKSAVKLDQIVSDVSLSSKDLITKAESFDKYIETYEKTDFKKSISSIYFPEYKGIAEARARQFAMRRLIDIALDHKNGIDQFTDAPMKTVTQPDGPLYYSIGQNLKDEKGIAYDSDGKKISGIDDIAIFVPM